MSNLVIYCHVSNWADLTSGSPWTFHTNTETGNCCCCWLATPYWGLVGARGPAGEETGPTGGVAVGVQEGAAATALVGPALGPAGAAGPVSIAVAGSLPATKAYEGPGGLAFGLAGRGAWQLAGTGATTLLARGVPAGMLPPERPGVCLGRLLGPLGGALAAGMLGLGGEPWACGSLTASPCLHSLGTP